MRSVLTVAVLMLALAAPAWADAPAADRTKILAAEMKRRSAELVPYLQADVDPILRRLAIRALGRIGDDGNAPGILRDMLATETQEPRLLMWAAGIAMSKDLAEPLLARLDKHLAAGEADLAAAAALALGWTRDEAAAGRLLGLLEHASPVVRAAALVGLARGSSKDLAALEKASALVIDDDADVRAAADQACWLLAGRYRAAASQDDPSWDGEPALAERFLGHLRAEDPERRMGGIRVLGSLLPKICLPNGTFGRIYNLLGDPDPRVVQDAIWRIFTKRAGEHSDAALTRALAHPDAKVRTLAAQGLGEHGTPKAFEALAARWDCEPDARVREVLAVELARGGRDEFAKKLFVRDDRPADPVVRQETEAQVLLVSQRSEALDELLVWADPGASQRAGLHAATWMSVLSGMEGKDHPKLDEWLMGFLAGGYAIDKPERHFVIAQAVGLAAKNKRHGLSKVMLAMLERTHAGPPHDEIHQGVLHEEIRAALMGAFADLAAEEDCPKETREAMRAAVVHHLAKDPSPWVRRAAREAATKLGLEEVPAVDDVGQPNTWRGIPQRTVALDEAGEPVVQERWLDEADIVRLADWIAGSPLTIVFETTAGSFTVALDAQASPVHAVSLVTAVGNGSYTNTRWHRVVPNFVIQGGDPHGHGGGGDGWTVPDEISENRFVRGALGMPKSVKDDGGCQLFFMHTSYHPLDERYTCYGHVVSGMEVVDAIRVGDFIRSARVVIGAVR